MTRALVLLASMLAAVPVSAQPPRIEVWGGVGFALDRAAGSVVSDYSPPLLLDGTDFTSRAGQTLSIAGRRQPGVSGGVNVFPGERVGVQLLAERQSFDVAGTSTPYSYTLRYVSRQPPDYVPQTFTTGNTVAWPDSSGSQTQLALAFNVVARAGDPQGTNVTFSGGPALVRLAGTVQPLGYTAYHMGGHAVLFEDDYRLAVDIGPEYAVGIDAGAEVNVGLGRHVAATAGYRYFGVRDVDAAAAPAAILNPDQISMAQPLADIAAALAPVRVRLSPSRSRVIVGLKVRY